MRGAAQALCALLFLSVAALSATGCAPDGAQPSADPSPGDGGSTPELRDIDPAPAPDRARERDRALAQDQRSARDARSVVPDRARSDGAAQDGGAQDGGAQDSGARDSEAPDLAPPVDCVDEQETPLAAVPVEGAALLRGSFEFAQSHVVRADERRRAPRIAQERETLLLFTPERPLDEGWRAQLQLSEGDQPLGVLPLAGPGEGLSVLEASLTDAPIEGYAPSAYSAYLPWRWVRDGVSLHVVFQRDDERLVSPPHRFEGLAAPHRFTLTRTRMVLFGEAEFEVENTPLDQLGRDFMPTLPFSELRLVESLPWRLDEIVIGTAEGARLVRSEAERQAAAPDTDHWSIIKNQTALRLSLANTGRGLRLTQPAEGDSSPFSWGTSVACGWFRDPEGGYRDIDDAPWAAGWTGWTALWLNQCGNVFIHEVGHSFTLAHFTEGTAARWEIGDEYPNDGVNLASHPWGYDTLRRQLRTWYRVGAAGPARDEAGALIGKRDPMNGGERANAETCFPQYTAYHAEQIQRWAEGSPVIFGDTDPEYGALADAEAPRPEGAEALFARWDPEQGRYVSAALEDPVSPVMASRVPVATLIGTLGQAPETRQIYPPIFSAEGNIFALPDPVAALPDAYRGSVYFVEVEYEDGARERGLIQEPRVDDARLALFALNLDLRRAPVALRLFESPRPYPEIDLAGAAQLFERRLSPPPETLPTPLRYGRGRQGGGVMQLKSWCDEGHTCARRSARQLLRLGAAPVSFNFIGARAGEGADAGLRCSAAQARRYTVPVVDELGGEHLLQLRAARVITSAHCRRESPPEDETPWCASAAQEQGLRLWIPVEGNEALPPGRYRGRGAFEGWHHVAPAPEGAGAEAQERRPLGRFPFEIDLEITESQRVELGPAPWRAPPVSAEGSSVYYLLRDSAVGPTERVWWDDPDADPVRLRVPARRSSDGAAATLIVDALHFECGETRVDLHAGRGANGCAHELALSVDPAQNAGLTPGERYETLPSAPLVIDARRWHEPAAQTVLETYRLHLSYTHRD